MTEPLPLCCARQQVLVTRAKGDLQALARRAARSRRDDVAGYYRVKIEEAKAAILAAEQRRDEHMHDDSLEHQ